MKRYAGADRGQVHAGRGRPGCRRPVDGRAPHRTDAQCLEIFRGPVQRMFAGIALTGATLRPDNHVNQELFGTKLALRILTGSTQPPPAAETLISTLKPYSRMKPPIDPRKAGQGRCGGTADRRRRSRSFLHVRFRRRVARAPRYTAGQHRLVRGGHLSADQLTRNFQNVLTQHPRTLVHVFARSIWLYRVQGIRRATSCRGRLNCTSCKSIGADYEKWKSGPPR